MTQSDLDEIKQLYDTEIVDNIKAKVDEMGLVTSINENSYAKMKEVYDAVVQKSGLLIAVEGVDGCGKTTFIKSFANELASAGIEYVTMTQLPQGPIRDIVLNSKETTELQKAALIRVQADINYRLIRSLLKEGRTVVMDRSAMSWYVYQSAALGAEAHRLGLIDKYFQPPPTIDHIVYLHLPPDVLVERLKARGDLDEIEENMVADPSTIEALQDEYMKLANKMVSDPTKNTKMHVFTTTTDADTLAWLAYESIYEGLK